MSNRDRPSEVESTPLCNRRNLLQLATGAAAGSLLSTGRTTADDGPTNKRSDIKITAVTTFHLRHQLKRPFGVSISVPLSTTRETLLVKIETDAGIVGWGETAPISGTRGTIEKHLKPRLIGSNPLAYRQLWRKLWGANFGNGMAVGGVETALNDIRGKALGLPVSDLFGGRLRDEVPVYVSALGYVKGQLIEDAYPATAANMVEQGHKAIKMRLGRYPIPREAKVAAKVRDTVGSDVKLMVDGNGGYTMGSALKMAHVLRDLDFEFFEEPLPQVTPRYTAYEELRKKMPLPLAGGEGIDSRGAGKDLIDRRAVDIIQPDLSLCGGLGEALFVAELAELAGIRCMPHCWGGDILIAASVHLVSLMNEPHRSITADTPLLELDQSENPFRDGLATEPLVAKNGKIAVPTKPGLGIEVNEEVVRRYAV